MTISGEPRTSSMGRGLTYDRGSNDGPCWSTVVCVRVWVKDVSIHGHKPRTVVRSTDRGSVYESGLSQFSELGLGGVSVVNHGPAAWAVV
uniref:Uncharacterized protein n=1 Tax=Solanum tuberosum TaxID=4113 RepID=M1DUQ2_SOLTU